jgi:hypothetical protein
VTQADGNFAGSQRKDSAEAETVRDSATDALDIVSSDDCVHTGDRIAQRIDNAELQITGHELRVSAPVKGGKDHQEQ